MVRSAQGFCEKALSRDRVLLGLEEEVEGGARGIHRPDTGNATCLSLGRRSRLCASCHSWASGGGVSTAAIRARTAGPSATPRRDRRAGPARRATPPRHGRTVKNAGTSRITSGSNWRTWTGRKSMERGTSEHLSSQPIRSASKVATLTPWLRTPFRRRLVLRRQVLH
jgi:hypothetical protein